MSTEVVVHAERGSRFGEQVRAMRMERNISCAKLARIVGLDCATLSRVESGERRPPELYPFVARLVRAFGLDIESGEAQDLMNKALNERFPNLPDFAPPRYLAIVGPTAGAGLSGVGQDLLSRSGGAVLADDAPERIVAGLLASGVLQEIDARIDNHIAARLPMTGPHALLPASEASQPCSLFQALAQLFATPPLQLHSLLGRDDDRGGICTVADSAGRKWQVEVQEIEG